PLPSAGPLHPPSVHNIPDGTRITPYRHPAQWIPTPGDPITWAFYYFRGVILPHGLTERGPIRVYSILSLPISVHAIYYQFPAPGFRHLSLHFSHASAANNPR